MRLYDPLEKSRKIERIVCRRRDDVPERKYFRFRFAKFYGGIATADVVGCNMTCFFCWVDAPRRFPHKIGNFYKPQDVARKLWDLAVQHGTNKLRISGGEPTICKDHLLLVLDSLLEIGEEFIFILETNGILIDRDYSLALSKYDFLHVRVSIKGCSESEFSRITGAKPEFFEYQLRSLENLLDAGVSCHPSVVAYFCTRRTLIELVERLADIDPSLARNIEIESLTLYPHVKRRLKALGLL